MNYYESVVVDYLRADRAIFVNTECCIQVNQADNPDSSGAHWYCDAVAVDFRSKEIFLCEISYAAELTALLKRLKGLHDNWDAVRHALSRDSFLPESWPVRPWLFVLRGEPRFSFKGPRSYRKRRSAQVHAKDHNFRNASTVALCILESSRRESQAGGRS